MDKERKKMTRCPFCGSGERRLFVVPFSGDYDNPCGWYVSCEPSDYGCGACGPTAQTEDEAIDAWNKRELFDIIKKKANEIYDDGGTYDDLDALQKIIMMINSSDIKEEG